MPVNSPLAAVESKLVEAVNALDELSSDAPPKYEKELHKLLYEVESALWTVQRWIREAEREFEER